MVDKPYFQLSALQHYAFCKRQTYLIHVEGLWDDNFLTVSGDLLHSKVDSGVTDTRNGIRQFRNIKIASHKYQMSGLIDMVEFSSQNEIIILEYKRGKPKPNEMDEVQICAQALCLEEMLGVNLKFGFIWYDQNKTRHKVFFSPTLRNLTISLINEVRSLFNEDIAPKPILTSSCKACSIIGECLPKITGRDKSSIYINYLFDDSYEEVN